MAAYYNELDPYAAAWLRNLIAAGHIAPGDVDERSILDVQPIDLVGYRQCHFFAGIGGWSLALRLAGWPDDRPVWTGSCPCQPFSAAGPEAGFDDERHLWPEFYRLIRKCRPGILFGEQVARAPEWADLVSEDLERENYAVATFDLPALCVGAKHFRHRFWIVAHPNGAGLEGLHGARRREHLQPVEAHVPRHQWQADPAVHRSIDGVSTRLDKPPSYRGAIRGLGNAIVPQVAAEVIGAYMDCRP